MNNSDILKGVLSSEAERKQTPFHAIKIRKKEVPARLERWCWELSFCIALYGISLKYQQFSLNLTKLGKSSVKLKNLSTS